MERHYAVSGAPIYLGRTGEDNVREIIFDISEWVKLYGEGTAQLMARRSGEDLVYPVPVEMQDGHLVVWKVFESDTAVPGGNGECELTFVPKAGQFKKSETWRTTVLTSLYSDVPIPPDPAAHWLDEARRNIASISEYAETASKAASSAAGDAAAASGFRSSTASLAERVSILYSQTSREAAEARKAAVTAENYALQAHSSERNTNSLYAQTQAEAEGAQAARQAIEDMAVQAVTVSESQGAAVRKDTTGGAVTLTFDIPKGPKGDTGATGPQGPKGDPGTHFEGKYYGNETYPRTEVYSGDTIPGSLLSIVSTLGFSAIVSWDGALLIDGNNGTVSTLSKEEINYINGVLTINTDSAYVNGPGLTYYYKSL